MSVEYSESLREEQERLLGLRLGSSSQASVRRLHSKYDPWKEAAVQIAGKLESGSTVFCFGAGLGYAVDLILRTGKRVVWIEPDSGILARALGTLDFREWIVSGQLRVLTRVEASVIEALSLRPDHVEYFSHRAFTTKELLEMRTQVDFLLNRKSVNQATLARFEKLWAVNLCGNLAAWSAPVPVRSLFGVYRGRPALVIGAGPSLDDVVAELRTRQESCIVIAVDTAVRILQNAGIDPDFIVTVDPQPVNRVFLESYQGNATIVVDPTVSYHSGRHFARKKIAIAATPFFLGRLFAAKLGGEVGDIAYGGSVSTNAYDLARKLGCDPVYLAGQDLAFSDGQVHARGASLEERLSWRESRTWRREMHNFAQRTAIPPLAVEDIRGGISPTNGKLAIFHAWFENRIEADRGRGLRTVNCTPRGALLKAAERGEIAAIPQNQIQKDLALEPWRTKPVSEDVAGLRDAMARVKQDYNRAFQEEGVRKERALDKIAQGLRGSVVLEAIGNAAQRAVQDALQGDPDPEKLHRELWSTASLLERLLARTARILKDQEEPGSSGENPQRPVR